MNPLKSIELAKDVHHLVEHINELHKLLEIAVCPSDNCHNGVLQLGGGGDIEQCQFCFERNDLLNN
jgi:hypothetical protein